MHGLELMKLLNSRLHSLQGQALPVSMLAAHESDAPSQHRQDLSFDGESLVDVGVGPQTGNPEVRCECSCLGILANVPPPRGWLNLLDGLLR